MSMQSRPWPQVLELTVQVARAVAARGPYPLAIRVRDELGELFPDTEFVEGFAERGRPGWSPGRLALVTVLQFIENRTDRAAAHRVRFGMDFKYALGPELDDPGSTPRSCRGSGPHQRDLRRSGTSLPPEDPTWIMWPWGDEQAQRPPECLRLRACAWTGGPFPPV
ncbi:transposase [Streptomyces sp. NPDC056309]|uniref:transposase n=1 Tax=unclassified Streptomyces TaxID=2593676 RepID=UPI0035E11C83